MNLKRAFVYLSLLLCLSLFCNSQTPTPVSLAPIPQFQAFDANGRPLAFGCVFTYVARTTTPLATFSDYTGLIQNSNPVILSASGSANIWIQAGQAYTFVVKSNGGTNCSLGTLMYSVDGVSGGGTQQTTIVTPSGGSATFTDQTQNQLFTLLLTTNVTGQPITATGVTPPGFITFQITQDGAGNHTFSWPANTVGAAAVCSTANCTTAQTFVWNGTNATAVGLASYSTGAFAAQNIFDQGLTALVPICTDANKQLSSNCTGLIPNTALVNSSVTFNGQTVALGSASNVNAGAAAHSVAINEAANNVLAGVTLANDQVLAGATGADPAALAIPNCSTRLTYDTTAHTFGCSTAPVVLASVEFTSCALAANGGEWNCQGNIAWGLTLPNTSYKVECTTSSPQPGGSYPVPAGYDAHIFFGTKTTTQTGYTINDDHSGSLGAIYTVDCIAIQ